MCCDVKFVVRAQERGRPVYEYPLNGQWIMLDMDDGYVLWTGIWKGTPVATVLGSAAAAHFFFLFSSVQRWGTRKVHPPSVFRGKAR